MPVYKRFPKKAERRSAEFRDWTHHVYLWLFSNWKVIVELMVVAGVTLILVFGARTYWLSRSDASAEKLFAAKSLETGSEKQLTELAGIADDYSHTSAGKQAMFWLGDEYMAKKDYESAVKEFEKLAGRSRNLPILKIASMHRLAEALIGTGRVDEACETYIKAAASPDNLVSGLSRLSAGYCFERAQKYDKAAEIYKQAIADAKDGDRQIKEKCEERLIWLISSGNISG